MSSLPIVEAGGRSYAVHHDWGKLPASIRYGNCHGVQVDSQGLVYIHHTVHESSPSDHSVVVFDQDGKFVTSWGGAYAGGAHGFRLTSEGQDEFLYFCDIRRGVVQKTDLDGTVLLTLGYPSESPAYAIRQGRLAPSWKPTNLAVARNGDIYIGDGYGSSYVVRYDRDGRYVNTFGGGRSDAAGDLDCPHGIEIDARSGREEILVADRSNHRLQYFDLDGNHLRFATGVDLPCHFDIYRDGTLLVPDLAARVSLFDSGNQLIGHLGTGSDDYRERRLLDRSHFPAGTVHLSARCLLRSQWQHLRRGVGRDRARHVPEAPSLARKRNSSKQLCLPQARLGRIPRVRRPVALGVLWMQASP